MARRPGKRGSPFIRIEGAEALNKTLRGLDNRTRGKAVKNTVAKSMTPIGRAIRKAAPQKTGALRRSLGKKTFARGEEGRVVSLFGVRRQWHDKKTGKIPNKYAKFTNPREWMGRTFDQVKGDGERTFGRLIWDRIEEEGRKGRRRR